MFIRVDNQYVDEYMKNDYLLPIMNEQVKTVPKEMLVTRTHQIMTMLKHCWKRAMFDTIYVGLKNKKILDIGGAYCGYLPLIEYNDYTLIEPDKEFKYLKQFGAKVFSGKWEDFKIQESYDYITCCDVFLTNARKLDVFLEKFLPHCKELRFTLTIRNLPKDRWSVNSLNKLLGKYGIEDKIFYKDIGLPGNRNVYIISIKN